MRYCRAVNNDDVCGQRVLLSGAANEAERDHKRAMISNGKTVAFGTYLLHRRYNIVGLTFIDLPALAVASAVHGGGKVNSFIFLPIFWQTKQLGEDVPAGKAGPVVASFYAV